MIKKIEEWQKLFDDINIIFDEINENNAIYDVKECLEDIKSFIKKAKTQLTDDALVMQDAALSVKLKTLMNLLQQTAQDHNNRATVSRLYAMIGKIEFFFQDAFYFMPKGTTLNILSFLDYDSLREFGLASKKNKDMANEEILWKQQCQSNGIELEGKSEHETYKALFAKNIADKEKCFWFVDTVYNIKGEIPTSLLIKSLVNELMKEADRHWHWSSSITNPLAAEEASNRLSAETYCYVQLSYSKEQVVKKLNEYNATEDINKLYKLFDRPFVIRNKKGEELAIKDSVESHENNNSHDNRFYMAFKTN